MSGLTFLESLISTAADNGYFSITIPTNDPRLNSTSIQTLIATYGYNVQIIVQTNPDLISTDMYLIDWCNDPTPSLTTTPTPTPSKTSLPTPSLSISSTPSLTPSTTPSLSISVTPSVTPSLSISSTITPTPSKTPSLSVSATQTPTKTPSLSLTPSLSVSSTQTPTKTPSLSVSSTVTPSLSISSSVTPTPSITPSCARPTGLTKYDLYYGIELGDSSIWNFTDSLADACYGYLMMTTGSSTTYGVDIYTTTLSIGANVYDGPGTSCRIN